MALVGQFPAILVSPRSAKRNRSKPVFSYSKRPSEDSRPPAAVECESSFRRPIDLSLHNTRAGCFGQFQQSAIEIAPEYLKSPTGWIRFYPMILAPPDRVSQSPIEFLVRNT